MPSPVLTVIIPVYNEERTLASVTNELVAALPDAQMIYVDDGSTDGSLAVLRAHARPRDIVLTKPNGGKGSAIILGLTRAEGAYTVIQDADLEYDPREISRLLAHGVQHPGTIVFGSRFLRENPKVYKRYLLGNKVMTLLINIAFGTRLTDSYTCYKLFPTPLLRTLPLQARGFELEAELCCYPLAAGVQIHELPITYRPRTLEEGKKIRFRDAWKGAWTILDIRMRSLLGRTMTHMPDEKNESLVQ